MLAGQPAHSDKAVKRPENVQGEIEDVSEEVTEQREAKAKDKAKKEEAIKNATSIQDQLSKEEKEKLKRAIPALEKRVAANPSDAKNQLLLGKAYLVEGKFEYAIKHLREAAAIPKPTVLYLLAEAYRGKSDYLNEIRTLDVILQTDENDPKVNELLGSAYYHTKNTEKSSQAFRKAIAADKKRRSAYLGLLKLFQDRKNRYEARQVYQDMAKAFGEDFEAYSGLCRLFTEDNLSDSALEYCRKAIEIDPNVADNHVYLGLTYKFLKEMSQAQKIIMTAAQQFPKSELALWAAGQLGDDMKNWESARLFYRKCTTVDPTSARCYKRLAQLSFELQDYGESLAAFDKACKLDRTVLTELRNATSQLRIKNITAWKDKFQTSSDKCGLK